MVTNGYVMVINGYQWLVMVTMAHRLSYSVAIVFAGNSTVCSLQVYLTCVENYAGASV